MRSTALFAGLALIASGAAAEPPSQAPLTWSEVLGPDAVAKGLLDMAIFGIRSVADLRYDDLAIDLRRGSIDVRGLYVGVPMRRGYCQVSFDHAGITGLPVLTLGSVNTRLLASGVIMSRDCLGRDGGQILAMTGQPDLRAQRIDLTIVQNLGSAATQVTGQVDLSGLAQIEFAADFDYLAVGPRRFGMYPQAAPFSGPDWYEPSDYTRSTLPGGIGPHNDPVPVAWLSNAQISVTDLGAWERFRPLLPGSGDPAILSGLVRDGVASIGPGFDDFADQAGAVAADFAADPGTISLTLRPEQPFDVAALPYANPAEMFGLLNPHIVNGPAAPLLPLLGQDSLEGRGGDADQRRSAGLALATGRGVPKNTERALMMLSDFESEPAIAAVMAGLLIDSDPARAYRHAQTAAAGGDDAGGLLDQIEAKLTVKQVLELQPDLKAEPDEADLASVAAMRQRASALEQGIGAARSYERAYLLASLAAATGDLAAAQIMARIDDYFDARDPAVWDPRRNEVQKRALEIWLDQDLASRLSGGAE